MREFEAHGPSQANRPEQNPAGQGSPTVEASTSQGAPVNFDFSGATILPQDRSPARLAEIEAKVDPINPPDQELPPIISLGRAAGIVAGGGGVATIFGVGLGGLNPGAAEAARRIGEEDAEPAQRTSVPAEILEAHQWLDGLGELVEDESRQRAESWFGGMGGIDEREVVLRPGEVCRVERPANQPLSEKNAKELAAAGIDQKEILRFYQGQGIDKVTVYTSDNWKDNRVAADIEDRWPEIGGLHGGLWRDEDINKAVKKMPPKYFPKIWCVIDANGQKDLLVAMDKMGGVSTGEEPARIWVRASLLAKGTIDEKGNLAESHRLPAWEKVSPDNKSFMVWDSEEGKWIKYEMASGGAPAAPTPGPEQGANKDEVILPGAWEKMGQNHHADCECSASGKMAESLAAMGLIPAKSPSGESWEEYCQHNMPYDPNPNKGYAGSWWDGKNVDSRMAGPICIDMNKCAAGDCGPCNYGAHAQGIANFYEKLGIPMKAVNFGSVADLVKFIKDTGTPVVIIISAFNDPGALYKDNRDDGDPNTWEEAWFVRGEHAVTVMGAKDNSVLINNPWPPSYGVEGAGGANYWTNKPPRWREDFGGMAVVYGPAWDKYNKDNEQAIRIPPTPTPTP